MAEGLDERDHKAVGEHRYRHAEIRQVTDPALGAVDVVVEEDVAGPHRLQREIAHDGLHERGVRAARELAAPAVVNAGAKIARLADHGRARRALDRGLDLGFHRGQRALDDLDDDRVDRRPARHLTLLHA
jgi:hypothetical protein